MAARMRKVDTTSPDGFSMLRSASILLLVSCSAALAAPPAAPAISESVFQKFLSVLPDRQRLQAPSYKADAKELADLSALNPGKEERIQAILETYEGCVGPANDRAIDNMLRHVAGQLGEAKIRTLTGFYEGADMQRVESLFGRIEAGETLPESDQAEADRLIEKYPLVEFRDAMLPAGQALANDTAFMAAVMACSTTREEALEREGIRQRAD